MSLPWENSLAVLELLSLVCSTALPRGTLAICLRDTHIMGSRNVLLYSLDTVPTPCVTQPWYADDAGSGGGGGFGHIL